MKEAKGRGKWEEVGVVLRCVIQCAADHTAVRLSQLWLIRRSDAMREWGESTIWISSPGSLQLPLCPHFRSVCWKWRSGGAERKPSQGSGERLYASTQTNRWTGLERRDKWIAQQVDSANMLQLAKLPTRYCANTTKHCRTSGNSFLFFLLCFFLLHII